MLSVWEIDSPTYVAFYGRACSDVSKTALYAAGQLDKATDHLLSTDPNRGLG